jgi:hypothetical protein
MTHEASIDGTKISYNCNKLFVKVTFETPYSTYSVDIKREHWFRFYRLMDGFNHALERHELK